ncbi:MAG: FAD:protein FMN transferase [Pseudomonadota bacterium]
MKRRAQPWLGTLVDITIADTLNDDAYAICFNAAFASIAEIHGLMSFHDQQSDVSRINRCEVGQRLQVHPYTSTVLKFALHLNQQTGGIFDIACASMLVAWGYLPSPASPSVDFTPGSSILVLENDGNVQKIAAGWIDLSGVAKGYAVDMAIAQLQRCGVKSACVNAGGDLRVYGELMYPVTIRDPQSPLDSAMELQLRNEALASSGNYFSQKQLGSALINGQTGRAITNEMSVSVRAAQCMWADALTKPVLATGDTNLPILRHYHASAFIIPCAASNLADDN